VTSKVRKVVPSMTNPVFWLGLGIGAVAGAIAAAGFSLSPSDAARMTGAMIGSLVAVAGAVSLHFLKERNDLQKRRKHLIASLEQLKKFNAGIITRHNEGDGEAVTAALRVSQRTLDRCMRYCSAFETEDERIAMVTGYLENIASGRYRSFIDEDQKYENFESSAKFVSRLDSVFRECVNILETGEFE